MTADFQAWLESIPEYVEYKEARDAELAAMTPAERARLEQLQAALLDVALYGETFIGLDGRHVPRNEARGRFEGL